MMLFNMDYGQLPKPIILIKQPEKVDYYAGDTLRFTIRNNDKNHTTFAARLYNKGYPDYYFTAYIYVDTAWKHLKQKRLIHFPVEEETFLQSEIVQWKYHILRPNRQHVFQFVIRGTPTINADSLEIRLATEQIIEIILRHALFFQERYEYTFNGSSLSCTLNGSKLGDLRYSCHKR